MMQMYLFIHFKNGGILFAHSFLNFAQPKIPLFVITYYRGLAASAMRKIKR